MVTGAGGFTGAALARRLIGLRGQAGYFGGITSLVLVDREMWAKIVLNLKVGLVTASTNREIIAVIGYLQRLGTDIKATPVAPTPSAAN